MTFRRSPLLAAFVALSMLPGAANAQQFTQATGVLPGPNRWSEGVTAADIDLDGDLDLLFANGDGFASAGTKRQNVLVINKLIEQGPGIFVDESVARFGVHVSNAKLVIAGDVTGDGYPDVLFANAFNTDPPFLYINRGAAQPGFFDLESASRGLTMVLSSAGAQFGDVDDDGDLDLVVTDTGPSFLGGPGATPRLYLNDGAGFFTDATAQLNAPLKIAQMDVSLVDIDNDWDIDILLTNRGSNSNGTHYLLLNDGTGNFTDRSTLLPNTSSTVYEAEVADLDGDLDRDLFFLSLSGFREGHMRNELARTGTLGFTTGALQAGNVDDNEIALIDYDMDGDFDILVGSLGPRERMYRNDGGLSFSLASGVLPSVSDSTLDLTVGDLDNDGDYDYVTAQGESGNFTNRMFLNSGPADTRAPLFLAVDEPVAPAAWPVKIHGRIRDQVMDDGETYVTVRALVARIDPTVVDIRVTLMGFVPPSLTVSTGTRIRFIDGGVGQASLAGMGAIEWTRDLPSGGSVERAFIAPVMHTVSTFLAAGVLQINVVGSTIEVEATHSGNAVYRMVIPALSAGPTAEFGYVLRAEDWVHNVGWSDSSVIRDPGAPGRSYCDPETNSTGAQARMIARGSDVLADQSIDFEAWALPTSSFGFFLGSRLQGTLPVSQGTLCLGTPFSRLSNFVQNSGQTGSAALALPFGALPPSMVFQVGDTWNFTYWFRDANPLVGANFTDGVEFTWR